MQYDIVVDDCQFTDEVVNIVMCIGYFSSNENKINTFFVSRCMSIMNVFHSVWYACTLLCRCWYDGTQCLIMIFKMLVLGEELYTYVNDYIRRCICFHVDIY